ncbi:MAG: hypothetical protein WD176_00620, partial [Pirellulales bacterium]
PAGTGVVDGQTFKVSDGVTTVTFEFEEVGGVLSGNTPIVFASINTAAKMATSIRDAINNHVLLNVDASVVPTSDRIELANAANVIVDTVPLNVTVSIAQVSTSETGSTTGTVSRDGPLTSPLVVALTSSDPTAATVPATVTIPIGQASATFNITPINDAVADGTQTAVIRGVALGYNSITDSIDVTDDEIAAFSVVIVGASVFNENAGAMVSAGRVTRNTPTTADLVVNLLSSDPSEARVPATVIIPAGAAFATFTIDAVNDPWIDGTQSATLTAYAAGFASGSAIVSITDDGLDLTPQSFLPGGFTTQTPPPNNGSVNPLKAALDHLFASPSAAGFSPTGAGNVIVTDQYVSAHTGVTHIYFRQQQDGLDVLGTEINVNVGPDGRVLSMGGSLLSSGSFSTLTVSPQLSAEEALRAAVGELIVGIPEGFEVSVLNHPTGPEQAMTLLAPDVSLDPIPVELKYVRVPGGVELTWSMIVRTADGNHWYDFSVDTDDGALPFVSDWVDNASYNV